MPSKRATSIDPLALKEADRAMRLGVISIGRQTAVPAIAKSRGANKSGKRFGFDVGLLCSKTFAGRIYENLFEASYAVARQSIAKASIKGRLQDWYHGGGDELSYLEVPLSECKKSSRPRCSHFPDSAAQHADVSLGGIGKKPGRTLAISRSELSDEILTAMKRDGLITVSDAFAEDPDAVALIQKLAVMQRRRWQADTAESDLLDLTPAMVLRV